MMITFPKAAAAVLMVMAAASAATILYRHIKLDFAWKDVYQEAKMFGGTCEVATGESPEGASFAILFHKLHAFRPMAMPYKVAAQTRRLIVPQRGYLLTRCHVATDSLNKGGFAALKLGRVYGDSAVYINGVLRLTENDGAPVTVPLTPADRLGPAELVILSRPVPPNYYAGMVTSDPPVATDSRDVADRIDLGIVAQHVEVPAFYWGLGLGLLLFFGTAWLLGLDPPEVTWMVILTGSFLLQFACWFNPTAAIPDWQLRSFGFFEGATAVALPGFLLAFMRLPRLPPRPQALALVGISTYGFGYWLLPTAFTSGGLYRLYVPYVSGALLLGAASVVGLRWSTALPGEQRRHARLVALTAGLSCLAYGAQVYESLQGVVFLHYVKLLVLLGFAGWLGADLVVFHRRYLEERAAREKVTRQATQTKAVSDLMQLLVHDLKQPFAQFSLALETIARFGQDPSDLTALATKLLPEMGQAKAAIEELLNSAKDVLQGPSAHRVPVDLGRLVKEAVRQVAGGYPNLDVTLDIDIAAATMASVDRAAVLRSLRNIIENAFQAMSGSGRFWARVEPDDNQQFLCLLLGNSGPLILAADLERIFEPFFTRGKASGTGIGLYGARMIIEGHGGRIRCTSAPISDTIFRLTLPRLYPDPAKAQAAAAARGSSLAVSNLTHSPPNWEAP